MLEAKNITKDFADLEEIKKLYALSFPRNERIPFWFLLMKAKKDFVDFFAYYDEDVFVGFVYLNTHNDLTFILYIAVNSEIQSKGYGSRILSHVKSLYPKNRIILNIEILDEKAENNEQRKRRKDFYIKNGYQTTGIVMKEYGVWYEVLITGGNYYSIEEYHALMKQLTGALLSPFYKYEIKNLS